MVLQLRHILERLYTYTHTNITFQPYAPQFVLRRNNEVIAGEGGEQNTCPQQRRARDIHSFSEQIRSASTLFAKIHVSWAQNLLQTRSRSHANALSMFLEVLKHDMCFNEEFGCERIPMFLVLLRSERGYTSKKKSCSRKYQKKKGPLLSGCMYTFKHGLTKSWLIKCRCRGTKLGTSHFICERL